MTVTIEQLQDAVEASRRMKNALDAHLRVLDDKSKHLSAEGRQIPSRNNFFLYVSDAQGLIRTQQDAAFVVEAVVVCEPAVSPAAAPPLPPFYELSLQDANAGRDLTGGFHPLYAEDPVVTEEDTNAVPGSLLVPITGAGGFTITLPNVDDWKTSKASYILPRASVVRAVFRTSGTQAPSTNPKVILAGYKIF